MAKKLAKAQMGKVISSAVKKGGREYLSKKEAIDRAIEEGILKKGSGYDIPQGRLTGLSKDFKRKYTNAKIGVGAAAAGAAAAASGAFDKKKKIGGATKSKKK